MVHIPTSLKLIESRYANERRHFLVRRPPRCLSQLTNVSQLTAVSQSVNQCVSVSCAQSKCIGVQRRDATHVQHQQFVLDLRCCLPKSQQQQRSHRPYVIHRNLWNVPTMKKFTSNFREKQKRFGIYVVERPSHSGRRGVGIDRRECCGCAAVATLLVSKVVASD